MPNNPPPASWRRLLSSAGALFAPSEAPINDYPFAPSDVALLHAGLKVPRRP